MSQDVVPGAVVFEYESTVEDLRETVKVLSRKQRGMAGLVSRPAVWVVLGVLGVAAVAGAAVTGSTAFGAFGSLLLLEALVLPWVYVLSARRRVGRPGPSATSWCRAG